MTTLSEVARLAGVTPATVSNVLRKRGRVGAQTRERVLEAVQTLGYRPHLAARALAEGRAPTVALMVSSIANPFYPEFALAVERATRGSGHFLIICNTNEDPLTGRAYLDQIAGTLSEGVLVTNANLDFADLHKTQARGTPVVLCMWERPHEPPGLPCVAVDFRHAGLLAGRHLLELGHTRIGAIVGSKASGIHAARYEGFVDALRDAGIAPPGAGMAVAGTPAAGMPAAGMPAAGMPVAGMPVAGLRHAPDTLRGGYTAARELLEADPHLTAIYATNDLPALGAIHAAADLGLDVPRDLSVIGITDIQLARESRPALTTVAVPTVEAAELAVSLLLELIETPPADLGASGSTPPMRVTAAPVLMVRGSTGVPRAGAA